MTESIHQLTQKFITVSAVKSEATYIKGEIITGEVISNTEGNLSLLLNNKVINIDSAISISEKSGEKISFEVTNIEKEKLQLKYISLKKSDNNIESNKVGTKPTKSIEITKEYPKELIKVMKSLEDEDITKINKILDQVKHNLNELVTKMTQEDVKSMLKEGLNPSKLSIELLTQVVTHNKQAVYNHDMDAIEEAVIKEVDKFKSKYSNNENLETTIKALKESNMPINKKNVEKIMDTLNQLDTIKEMASKNVISLLKEEGPISINEAYKAVHTPVLKRTDLDISQEDMIKLVKGHLNKIGVTPTDEAVDCAIEMVKNQVDITKEKVEFALNPSETFDEINQDEIAKEMVNKLKENQAADTVIIEVLSKVLGESVNIEDKAVETLDIEIIQLVNKLQKVEDRHIIDVTKNNKVVTLEKLFAEQEISDKAQHNNLENETTQESYQKTLANKRQLEEIRLKMTVEAATRLDESGIKIETEPLEKVVEALRASEKELYQTYMKAHNVELSGENIQEVQQTMEKLAQVKSMLPQGFMLMSDSTIPTSIEALADSVQVSYEVELADEMHLEIDGQQPELTKEEQTVIEARINLIRQNQATVGYEVSGTKVRSDLGDSIERTFDQIEPILNELELEATPSRIEAVKILARNGSEITTESILEIELLNEKVTRITTQMNPHMVVEMIKSGVTPLELSINEMLDKMAEYEEEFGETEGEKISRLINELDQSSALEADERESLIGIYRMFNTVVRSKGTATGLLVKNSMSLTIDHLFEAAKYIKKTGGKRQAIAVEIDQEFGQLEAIESDDKSIKEQILTTHSNETGDTEKEMILSKALLDLRLKAFISEISHSKMVTLVKTEPIEAITKMPLEALQEVLQEIKETPSSTQEPIEKLLEFVRGNEDVVKTMIKNDITLTQESLEHAMALNEETFALVDRLRKAIDTITNQGLRESAIEQIKLTTESILTGKESVEALEKVLKTIEQEIVNSDEEVSLSFIKNINESQKYVKHVRMVQLTQDYYQIPIMMGNQLSQLNMYILNNQEETTEASDDGMKVYMSFNTINLGKVQILADIKGNQMSMNVQIEEEGNGALMEIFKEDMIELIGKTNYTLSDVGYQEFEVLDPVTKEVTQNEPQPKQQNSTSSKFEVQI